MTNTFLGAQVLMDAAVAALSKPPRLQVVSRQTSRNRSDYVGTYHGEPPTLAELLDFVGDVAPFGCTHTAGQGTWSLSIYTD